MDIELPDSDDEEQKQVEEEVPKTRREKLRALVVSNGFEQPGEWS